MRVVALEVIVSLECFCDFCSLKALRGREVANVRVRGGFAQAVNRDLELKRETLSCLDKNDAAERFVGTVTGSVVGDSERRRIGFIHPDLKSS